MTGLLAFNDDLRSRKVSTGPMGLPKSFSRSRSLNAKYDRMLGSTQSVRTGKGSTRILAEVGTQFRLSGEEKQEKIQRDNAEIYRKLGIKMPAKGSRETNGEVGVMEKLERYRLGNVPPPRGNTPPVELDEKLRKILYPSPPPPAPLTPSPPAYHPQTEHFYPTGSRVGHSMQGVYPQPTPSIVDYRQYQSQGPSPPYPPPPPAMGGQVNGWVFTQANGWIFIPLPQPYPSAYHGYPPFPPPLPPAGHGYAVQPAYPSPYSDVPSSSVQGDSPLKYYTPEHPSYQMRPQQHHSYVTPRKQDSDPRDHDWPHTATRHPENLHAAEQQHFEPRAPSTYTHDSHVGVAVYPNVAQTQSFPKGILRDSSSSETSGHGRSVTFRDTPDYAFPEMFAQEVAEGPRSEVCSPPEWKLRKIKPASRAVEPEQVSVPSQAIDYQDEDHIYDEGGTRTAGSIKEREEEANGNEIPALLTTAHQQLVSNQGVPTGVSGKRSGRDLVRNLETLAEMQNGCGRESEQDSPAPTPMYALTNTPRPEREQHDARLRQAPQMNFESTTRHQSIPANEVSTPWYQDRVEPGSSTEVRMSTVKHQNTPWEGDGQGEYHQPRQVQIQDATRSRRHSLSGHETPHPQDQDEAPVGDGTSIDGSQQNTAPSPEQAIGQARHRYATQAPHAASQAQKLNKTRLPPPSQNWRESQRPQMAYSQNDSQASQDMGSQLSVRTQNQDQGPEPNGKKRRRQEWRDDEDEYEGGSQNQENQTNMYSPDQDSYPNHNHSQAESMEQSHSQANQEQPQSQERRPGSMSLSSTAPISSSIPHRRHRLTNLEVPPDDDPSDHSYHADPIAEEEDELESDDSQTRKQTASPEYEPEGKRIKLTKGAWAKYDIPQDKLPAPAPIRTHVPFLQSYQQSRFSHLNKNKKQDRSRNEVNDENIKSSQTQSQSQISQIDNPDDEDEMENWMNEDIDEMWSQCLSDPPIRDVRGGKALSTIAEEEGDEELLEPVADVGGRGNRKGWVEEGFFGDGGDAGFRVWRDRD